MGTKAPPVHPDMGPGSQSRAHHRRSYTVEWMEVGPAALLCRAVCLTGTLVQAGWYLELYLKLLLLPGLLSNFLLSRGNLSPAMSNIFSASWKKVGRHHQVQRKLLLPKFQKTEHVSRNKLKLDYTKIAKSPQTAFPGTPQPGEGRFQWVHLWMLTPRLSFPQTPALCYSKVSLSHPHSHRFPHRRPWPCPGCCLFSWLWPLRSDHFGGFFNAPWLTTVSSTK